MNKINIKLLQKQLDEACEELIAIKTKERILLDEKEANWAPLAEKIAVHRDKFNSARDETKKLEQQKKLTISSIYDAVSTIRDKMTNDALLAKARGDMEEVQKLTLMSSELSLRMQPGVILQNDIAVEIEDFDKIPKSFLKNNEKIKELLITELRKYARKCPHEAIPGVVKREVITVKVREGQQKKL